MLVMAAPQRLAWLGPAHEGRPICCNRPPSSGGMLVYGRTGRQQPIEQVRGACRGYACRPGTGGPKPWPVFEPYRLPVVCDRGGDDEEDEVEIGRAHV